MSEVPQNAAGGNEPTAVPTSTVTKPGSKLARVIGIVIIVIGVIFTVAGVVAYVMVQQTLSDQRITVSEDADMFAGDRVEGPFSAYAQAMVIGEHATEMTGGKTYAELPRDDPNRDTVMTASFLQASLFTSVVAFGVSAMAAVLGLALALIGWVLFRLGRLVPAPSPVLVT